MMVLAYVFAVVILPASAFAIAVFVERENRRTVAALGASKKMRSR